MAFVCCVWRLTVICKIVNVEIVLKSRVDGVSAMEGMLQKYVSNNSRNKATKKDLSN